MCGGGGGGGGGGVTLSDQLVVNTAIISVKTGADRLWSSVRGSPCRLSYLRFVFLKELCHPNLNIENNFPSAV